MSDQDRLDIVKERGKVYGPPGPSSRRLGRIWRASIEHYFDIELPGDIPAHVVDLMLAHMKLFRATCNKGGFHQDNYTDALNYTDFAADEDPRNPATGERFR